MGPAVAGARLPVWWRAARPFSFTASVTPVVVGTAAAAADGVFHPGPFLAALAASVAIHAGTNLANDYYDHVRGVDASQPVGPGGAIQRGLLSPRAVLRGALALFAVAVLPGLYLVALRGWPIVAIGALSILAGYAYTGGPVPLGYAGLGDLVVFLFLGVVAVAGACFVQTGTVTAAAIWAALPVGALVDAILVANNLRDLANDRAKGKRTLAARLGPRAARLHFLGLLCAAYAAPAAGVLLGALPATVLLAALTIPSAAEIWRTVRGVDDPLALTLGGVRATARLHARVGILIAAGLVLPRL